jgi:hypothetical protein
MSVELLALLRAQIEAGTRQAGTTSAPDITAAHVVDAPG